MSTAPLGQPLPRRRIKGPSAFEGDVRRFVHLTWTLAFTEFKLKFFGSVLGYVWQLMRPLLLFGVLYVVFTQFLKIGDSVRFYPALLLTNIVIYTFFADATGGAVASVVDRENLVRKIHFPRVVIPLSVVVTAYLNVLVNFIAVLVFMAVAGVELRLTWVELPLLMLVLGIFCTGLAMVLSALFVRYRDMRPIWDIVLQVAFYASPVIYAIEVIPNERVREGVMLNPLSAVLQQVRHSVIDPDAASAAAAAGGAPRLLVPLAIVVLACGLGFWLFNREAGRMAEEL